MAASQNKILSGVEWYYDPSDMSYADTAPAVGPYAVSILVSDKFFKISNRCGFVSFIPGMMEDEFIEWLSLLSVDIREIAARYNVPNGEIIWPMKGNEVALLKELFQSCQNSDAILFRLRSAELLIRLSRMDINACIRKPVDPSCTPRQALIARSVCTYMLNHLGSRITIKNLSEVFRLSQTQIKQSYTKYYGESIFRHMRDMKLRTALYLLNETSISVSEIASKCGYQSLSKFSKAFAGKYGQSPAEYRKFSHLSRE